MLTNRNMMANTGGVDIFDEGQTQLGENDVYISYLPLAHVLERQLFLICLIKRIHIGYYQGDVFKLREDLMELKPTIMVSVPRLFNRFYDTMQKKISELEGLKRTLADWGVQKKLTNLSKSPQYTQTVYDSLVFG